MDQFYQPSSICFFDSAHWPVGTGIYVGDGLILSCEHVVVRAQGGMNQRAVKDQDVAFEFAFSPLPPIQEKPRAKVLELWPSRSKRSFKQLNDVAVLQIIDPETIPDAAAAAPLADQAAQPNTRARVFGFSKDTGCSVAVTIGCQGRDDLVELEFDPEQAPVEAGHSGSPVWDNQAQVIGMVIERDAKARSGASSDDAAAELEGAPKAYMLPVGRFGDALDGHRPDPSVRLLVKGGQATTRSRAQNRAQHHAAPSYLAIAVVPTQSKGARQYTVEARLAEADGDGWQIDTGREGSVALSELRSVIRDIVNDKFDPRRPVKALKEAQGSQLRVELFLPIHLLAGDLDRLLGCEEVLCPLHVTDYVVTRTLVRLGRTGLEEDKYDDPNAFDSDWKRFWTNGEECREQIRAGDKKFEGLSDPLAPNADTYDVLAKKSACVLLLDYQPDPSGRQLAKMLQRGAGAIVWCRPDLPRHEFRKALINTITHVDEYENRQACLRDLPLAMRHLRRECFDQSGNQPHTGGYHVLWDDPDRIPQFTATATRDDRRLTNGFDTSWK